MSTDDPLALYYNENCLVCQEKILNNPIGTVRDHEYSNTTKKEFPVISCHKCGLVFLNPRPSVSELSKIYPENYYSYHLTLNETKADKNQPSKFQSLVQSIFKKRNLKYLEKKLSSLGIPTPEGRPLRVLDIGCGTGHQLNLLKEVWPDCETHGIEMGELAAQKASQDGHIIYHGKFEDLSNIPNNYFDYIFSVHVIEHVDKPDRFLEKCKELLVPSGRILIETPSTNCIDFKLFKHKHWGGYHAPRHWYLFNPENLALMGTKLGLKPIDHQYYQSSVFWNWTMHSMAQSVLGEKIAKLLFPPVKIFYGGVRSFILLGTFSVLGNILQRITKTSSAFWMTFAKA